ncbi:hypothetical protein FBUS_03282 [Fasciolopsis buskii]|uniref:Uncharacterized protein n=1 Tax=Fasciolopsis buskii TaxID=27845 RepID=A0A8E0S7I4_9TREM|nr:hypothetical protein FBUS_03282 [Fasciolopsis buski]
MDDKGRAENLDVYKQTQDKSALSTASATYENLAEHSWNVLSRSIRQAYGNIPVERVVTEERNVYCGTYNTLVLLEK